VSYKDRVNGMRPQCVGISISRVELFRSTTDWKRSQVTRLSQQRVKGCIAHLESVGVTFASPPQWMHPGNHRAQKTAGGSARWKGLGAIVSVAIAVVAILALMHALKNVDYGEVFAIVRRTISACLHSP